MLQRLCRVVVFEFFLRERQAGWCLFTGFTDTRAQTAKKVSYEFTKKELCINRMWCKHLYLKAASKCQPHRSHKLAQRKQKQEPNLISEQTINQMKYSSLLPKSLSAYRSDTLAKVFNPDHHSLPLFARMKTTFTHNTTFIPISLRSLRIKIIFI